MVSSYEPLAKIVPFLLNATAYTELSCPFNVANFILDSIVQSFIVLSEDPLASIFIFLLNATDKT